MDVPAGTAARSGGAAAGGGGGARSPAGQVYLASCLRCNAPLRIIDDLPPAADFGHSFRGSLGESFVVVQASDPDEFIERRNSGPGLHGAEGQPRVPSLEEVSRVEKIMALASGQSETDHPVCGDCLNNVIAEVKRQLDEASEEQEVYQEAHSRLER